MAATSISASAFLGSWGTSIAGEDHAMLQAKVAAPPHIRMEVQPRLMMDSSKGGIFAPAIFVTRNIIGKKRFDQLRGKVITEFCKSIGADNKRTAGADSAGQEEWRVARFSCLMEECFLPNTDVIHL